MHILSIDLQKIILGESLSNEPWQSTWSGTVVVKYQPYYCSMLRYNGDNDKSGEYRLSSHSTTWNSGVPVYKHLDKNYFIYQDEIEKWKIGGLNGLAKRKNSDTVVASSRSSLESEK